MAVNDKNDQLLVWTAEIVSAHVASNSVHAADLPKLIQGVYDALDGLGAVPAQPVAAGKPQAAVSARKSLASPDHILSMIDGKPYKMLRRHLGQNGYTPESYRATFGLPRDYPMVAPSYAEQRRKLAHKIGLGRKPRAAVPAVAAPAPAPAPADAPKRRGRKPKATSDAG